MSEATQIDHLAGQLYTVYCAAVGGVSFRGEPLPTWADFVLNPKTQTQSEAWRATAREARKQLLGG